MPFQSAPDCAETVINATLQGKAMANVLNWWKPTGYSLADLVNLGAVVDEWVGTDYKDWLPAALTYNNTTVRGLALENDEIAVVSTSTGVGIAAGAAMPANVALCITLRSAFTGRSARGRFFALPSVVAAADNAQTFDDAYAAAMVTMLEGMKTDALSFGWTFVVLSRWNAGVKRATAIPFAIQTIQSRNLSIDSQRGRLLAGH